MAHTILLYGATGYTGRLIASELRLRAQESHNGFHIILAGRRGDDVKSLAANLGFDARVFCLGVDQLSLHLRDVNVTINAAGPFAATRATLALAALAAGSHYLDINGEPDVYYDLTELDQSAALAQRAILSGCGFWAGASNILLDNALRKFLADENAAKIGLGAVRIAASRIAGSSRGAPRRSCVLFARRSVVASQELRKRRSREAARPRSNCGRSRSGKLNGGSTLDRQAAAEEPKSLLPWLASSTLWRPCRL